MKHLHKLIKRKVKWTVSKKKEKTDNENIDMDL